MVVEVQEVSAVSSRFPRVLLRPLHPRRGHRAAVLRTRPEDRQEPLEGVEPGQAEWEPQLSDTLSPLFSVIFLTHKYHCNFIL